MPSTTELAAILLRDLAVSTKLLNWREISPRLARLVGCTADDASRLFIPAREALVAAGLVDSNSYGAIFATDAGRAIVAVR